MDMSNARQRQMVLTSLAGVGLVGLVIAGLWWSDPQRKVDAAEAKADAEAVSKQFATPASVMDPAEVWITRSEAQLADMQKQNAELAKQVAELTKAISGEVRDDFHGMPAGIAYADDVAARAASGEGTTAGEGVGAPGWPGQVEAAGDTLDALPQLPPAPAPEAAMPPSLPAPPPSMAPTLPVPVTAPAGQAVEPKKPGILSLDLGMGDGEGTPAWQGTDGADDGQPGDGRNRRLHNIRQYLPAGSFVKAALLSGLDAPTGGQAQSNPQPVLLRLVDDGTLPNQFSSRIRSCHLTAAGYGDISSERAYLRLERMSCVLRDGKVVDSPIKGFVTGEDGKAGMRGNLVSKQGQMIAKALVSGVAGGIGSGISEAYSSISTSATTGTVTTVDPGKIGQFGVANGFGKTLEKVADWYLQRANETYPIIEVASGRSVDIVLTEGFGFGVDILAEAAPNWSDDE